MSSHKKYIQDIDLAIEVFDKSISVLATRFRHAVIKPLCRKYNLQFISGNGDYYFSNEDDVDISSADYPSSDYETVRSNLYQKYKLKPIFDTLDKEVSRAQYFGYYVSSYKPNRK